MRPLALGQAPVEVQVAPGEGLPHGFVGVTLGVLPHEFVVAPREVSPYELVVVPRELRQAAVQGL